MIYTYCDDIDFRYVIFVIIRSKYLEMDDLELWQYCYDTIDSPIFSQIARITINIEEDKFDSLQISRDQRGNDDNEYNSMNIDLSIKIRCIDENKRNTDSKYRSK